MAETRKLLRQARECLQKKEYQEAISVLKTLLKEDRNCYEAYVFVGKAAYHLQEYAQAEAAYTRGTSLDAANPLAWQGLGELHTETGAWDKAYHTHMTLYQLLSSSPDPGTAAKAAGFHRKAAEAAVRAGLLPEAEQRWSELVEGAPEEATRLEYLCHLADTQLAIEDAELHRELAAAAGSTDESAWDMALAERLEAEWAEQRLAAGAAVTLRTIVNMAPPSPHYTRYYEAYLHRLRMAARGAPVGSMERHARRADVLNFSLQAIQGLNGAGTQAGGCCTEAPYEAALAMLEVEGDVVATPLCGAGGEPQTHDMERVARRLAHSTPWNAAAAVHLALCVRRRLSASSTGGSVTDGGVADAGAQDCESVTDLRQQDNLIPPANRKHLSAAAKRRRLIRLLLGGLRRGACSAAGWLAASELLLEEGAGQAALDAATQGLSYLAAREALGHETLVQADLLFKLAAGRAMAVMVGVPSDPLVGYTLHVIKAVHDHQVSSGQSVTLPDSLVQMVQRHPPLTPHSSMTSQERGDMAHKASLWLEALLLSGRVCGGEAPFARLAGSGQAADIHQQASQCLAQLALARGDVCKARELYETLVGAAAVGRVDAGRVAHWVAAEYGALLVALGELQAALCQMESALTTLQGAGSGSGAPPPAEPLHHLLVGRYHLLAGHIAWACGGELRSLRGAGAHQHLLQSAAAADSATQSCGPDSPVLPAAQTDAAEAFTLLGCWYQQCGGDTQRGARCYQRALALDPEQDVAGEALVEILLHAGDEAGARSALDDCVTRSAAHAAAVTGVAGAPPTAVWAVRLRARLQLASGAGGASEAMPALQNALRQRPQDGQLWELLGAAYHQLGRHTAALRSYSRALELCPGRVYCAVQSGALEHQQGDLPAALKAYDSALAIQPLHPAALLGAATVCLAMGVAHAAAGVQGLAADALERAAQHATTATQHYGNIQAGWKLLGHALVQHADVAPLSEQLGLNSAATSKDIGTALRASASAQAHLLTRARRAYAAALHLDPTQGQVWGDAALACHLEASLGLSVDTALPPHTTHHNKAQSAEGQPLQQLASRLLEAGLKLEPTSDALWSLAGEVAAAQATSQQHHPQASDTQVASGGDKAPRASAPPGFARAQQQDHDSTNTTHLGSSGPRANTAKPAPTVQQLLGRAEVCLVRALQLNSSRGPAWAALARLYAQQGHRDLAAAAAERCRLVDPRLVAVWEAMAVLAGSNTQEVGGGGWREQLDAWEHAVGLGGGCESWLGFATGSVLVGRARQSSVLAAAVRAAAQQPLLPEAHNVVGAVWEARGQYTQAVQSYRTALLLQKHRIHTAQTETEVAQVAYITAEFPDGAGHQQVATAIKANLARALARMGAVDEAVQLYRELEAVQAVQQDIMSLVTYGTLLLQEGDVQGSIQILGTAVTLGNTRLNAAITAPTADLATPLQQGVMPLLWRQLLSALLAMTHAYLQAGRPSDAHAMVKQHLGRLPPDQPQLTQPALQLWQVLLVAAASAGNGAAAAFGSVVFDLLAWCRVQPNVNKAEMRAFVHSVHSAGAAAHGALQEAFSHAARAVHCSPWQPHWRLRLAQMATESSTHRAYASLRITPIPTHLSDTCPDGVTAAAAVRTLHSATAHNSALSQAACAADAPANRPLAVLTPGALTPTATGEPSAVQLRSAGLLLVQPTAALPLEEQQQVVDELVRVVHLVPCDPGSWYLLALVSLQLANDTGHAALYRKALTRAKVALVCVRRALRQGPEQGDVDTTAAMVYRLLIVWSECHLHARVPGGVDAAREAANKALQWAQERGLAQGLALRQLGRVAAAVGDRDQAEQAYTAAVEAGDGLAVLEHLCLSSQPATTGAAQQGPLGHTCELLQALKLLHQGEFSAARELLGGLEKQLQGSTTLSQGPAHAAALTLLSRAAASVAHSAVKAGQSDFKPTALEAKWAASSGIRVLSSLYGPDGHTTQLHPATTPALAPAAAVHVARRAGPSLAAAAAALATAEALLGKQDKAAAALNKALCTCTPDISGPLLVAQVELLGQDSAGGNGGAGSVAGGKKKQSAPAGASMPGEEQLPEVFYKRSAARLVHAYPSHTAAWRQLQSAAGAAAAT